MTSGYKFFSIALQETTIIKHVKPAAIIVDRKIVKDRKFCSPFTLLSISGSPPEFQWCACTQTDGGVLI
jgi:hypothetical protein